MAAPSIQPCGYIVFKTTDVGTLMLQNNKLQQKQPTEVPKDLKLPPKRTEF